MENMTNTLLDWIENDRENIIRFCSALVRCKTPSTTGDTRQATALVKDFFTERGIGHKELAACKTMPNLISSTQMQKEGRHLMFNGHMDVMPAGKEPGWKDDPWSGAVKNGRIWGRGTSDMKAGVTSMLFAYSYLHKLQEHLSGRLSISIVSDEETGWGRGTGFLFEQIPEEMLCDCVLSGEPSGADAISFSSKGYISLTIDVETRGAIAGYSNESKNAVEIAADVMHDLKKLEQIPVKLPQKLQMLLDDPKWVEEHEKLRGKGHAAQLSKITVDICTIRGGSLSVVIPADCRFTVSIVIPLGTDVPALLEKIRKTVTAHPEATLRIDGTDLPDCSEMDGEMPSIIQTVSESLGLKRPVLTPDIAISDCRYWRYRNIPAYWYGIGGENCSAANESIRIDELMHMVKVHTLSAFHYLHPQG